jgi:hypothetical protein
VCFPYQSRRADGLRPRSVAIVTPPRVEPVALTDAKEHLRILPENAEDDVYIQGLISAGRRIVEARLGIAMVATQYRARVCGHVGCSCSCGCNDRGIELPFPPLLVDEDHPLTVTTDDGLVDPDHYEIDADSKPAKVVPRKGWRGGAEIIYWAGMRPGETQPATLKAAVLLLVGHLYKNREAVTTDGGALIMPLAFDALVAAESWSGRF